MQAKSRQAIQRAITAIRDRKFGGTAGYVYADELQQVLDDEINVDETQADRAANSMPRSTMPWPLV